MNITSLQNEKVKYWVRLQEKKFRDQENLFLIEGDHLVKEALKRNTVKEIITIGDTCYQDIPTYFVTKDIMKKISLQKSPSFVVAVCEKLKEKAINGSILLLDNIQDPGNLGTMIRSAVAFGVENIILSDGSVDLYNPKVIRSTEGMFFHVNIVRQNLEKILPILKNDYELLGTDVTNGIRVENIILKKPFCLIIGSEGKGMSENTKKYCDQFIYIPMKEACESLNAGVSASILMYELEKRGYHE